MKDKAKVALLKKMLKGLTPKKNFDPDSICKGYPHCVIAERNRIVGYIPLSELFSYREARMCTGGSECGLTHARALAMIRRAIRRWSK